MGWSRMVRNGTRMLEPVGLIILGGDITRDMKFLEPNICYDRQVQ
jgi:hypothetical protein